MRYKKKFMQAAGLVVGDPLSSEESNWLEQNWLQRLIEELEWSVEMYDQILDLQEQIGQLGQEESSQEKELWEKVEELEEELQDDIENSYSIAAPSYLSKGGLSDLARVLSALLEPDYINERGGVQLDLSEATGLPYIAAGTFTDCDVLESVVLPPSVREISQYAFCNCGNLTSVDIPEGVTTIGDSAFYNCGGLDDVDIPASVTTIGDSAFSSCSNLTSVDIPEGVITIGDSAFSHCDDLTSVEIPASVREISKWAFSSCSNLTSVNIPPSVTTIGDFAFSFCENLTSVEIPASVTTIGYHAFDSCKRLRTVKVEAETPPALGGNRWGEYPVFPTDSLTKIQVPSGSVAAYKAAEGWKDYAEKIEAITP